MEPITVCKNCGEKASTNFSSCQKCGAELPKNLCPLCGYTLIRIQNKEKCTYCGFPDWTSIEGEVTSISVKKRQTSENSSYWQVYLLISYSVAGQTYSKEITTKLSHRVRGFLGLFGGYTYEDMMKKAHSRYPLGTKIPFFYNSNNPSHTRRIVGGSIVDLDHSV